MQNFDRQQIGRYKLISPIGSGGFAEVYLGEHIDIQKQAAVKILNHTHLTERDIEQFRQEARTIASLQHKNIVKIEYFDVENGIPYLVMQYAPNGTLHYPAGTRLPLPTVAHYIQQISEALHYAHARRIVHCDIKPENMLLGSQHEVLLSDFGIAVITQSSAPISEQITKNQEVAGTINYMAPEQFYGEPGPASDQYALGIVAYEWLCGSAPFGGTKLAILTHHLNDAPPPLRKRNPAVPPEVEKVVLRALEKEPGARYPSINDFNQAFQAANALQNTKKLPENMASYYNGIPPRASHGILSLSITSLLTMLLTLLIVFFFVRAPWGWPSKVVPNVVPVPSTQKITLKIAVDMPLSGNDAHDGQPVLNAINLAIAQGKSALPSYDLKVDVLDDVGANNVHDANKGRQNIQAFSDDAQVAAIIGPFNSDVAQSEIPVANQNAIALISPSATSRCLTVGGPVEICPTSLDKLHPKAQNTFFRAATLDNIEGARLADYLIDKLSYKTAYIIRDNGLYGLSFSQGFESEWKARTHTDPHTSTLPSNTDQKGYEGVINDIVSTGKPDIVFYAGNTPNATLIHTLIEQNPQIAQTTFAAGGGIINASFVTNIQGLQSGPVYAITPIGDINSSGTIKNSGAINGLSFYTSYISAYNDQPTPYSASAYDCTNIVINAIKTALLSSTAPTGPKDGTVAQAFRQQIITAIENTSYDGVTNHYSFDRNGDTANQTVSLYQLNIPTQRWGYLPTN